MFPAPFSFPFFCSISTAILACLLPLSCSPPTRFERPILDLPQGQVSSTLSPTGTPWWSIFHNEDLNRLEKRALQYNRDLIQAAAIVDKAIALSRETAADELPHAEIRAGARTEELTKGQQYTQSLSDRGRDLWSASGVLSYEVDLWGKLRAQSEAARADVLASMAARDAVCLRLTGEVASAYISVCTWQEKCGIIERVHASYNQTCSMYEKRFEQGQYPELELRRVQAERARTLAQLEKARNYLSQAESLLAVLVGDSPRAIMKSTAPSHASNFLLSAPPSVPSGIPSDVINKRPDLFELESRLKSAYERQESARTDRLPSLTLTAELGHVSTALDELLNQPSRLYNVGGDLMQTLFDGGKKKAVLDAASAEYTATKAAYEQCALTAFREIRDALVERRQSAEIYKASSDEVNRLRRSWDIASKQYAAGYIGLMDTLDTHRSLLSGELDQADAAEMRLNAVVKVCKALGGGWQQSVKRNSTKPSSGEA